MTKVDPNTPVTMRYLNEGIEAVLNAIDLMQKSLTQEIRDNKEYLENRINHLEANIKDDIEGLKGELALTVTKKEFYETSKRKTLN